MVVVLLDDVGFGASSTFGGPAETPGMEALAAQGCATTAFTLPPSVLRLLQPLTGRDAHRANMGTVMNVANTNPGYQGVLNPHTATVVEMLRQRGYSAAAFGKWHLTPSWESSPMGPFRPLAHRCRLSRSSTAFWAANRSSTPPHSTRAPHLSSLRLWRTTTSVRI